jgi:phytoene dehydrogenase-like protein
VVPAARPPDTNAIVLGAGHNGLVAAALLARRGLGVTVLEARERVGGASVTERPFRRAPDLGCSTGAYLLGPMPPELMAELGLELPLVRRDPHYFLPTTGERHLLLGSDAAEARRQLEAHFSAADWEATLALGEELAAIREDLAPAWLRPPVSLEETAERHLRPALRGAFVELCRGSVGDYLERFGFRSDLLRAMYAVTDGFPGGSGGYDTPGGGANLLAHNMCRLPGADGTWMMVRGGMGTVTARLAQLAERAGARVRTGAPVARIRVAGGAVAGVTLAGGEELDAPVVLSGADPFTTLDLLPAGAVPRAWAERIRGLRREGTTLKVNLCLRDLPSFRCLPGDPRVWGPTIHLLPDEDVVLGELRRAHREAVEGVLPERPPIEWYLHTTLDPSLRDRAGRHSGALFVQWVPHTPRGGSWDGERERYAAHLLELCDRYAPGTSALVEEVDVLAPPDIERRFGIAGGHIHHVDNAFAFDERAPYATPVEGLWLCGAGCHPAGSVIGAAGRNAAALVASAVGLSATRR